jgi:hypothetical protein
MSLCNKKELKSNCRDVLKHRAFCKVGVWKLPRKGKALVYVP